MSKKNAIFSKNELENLLEKKNCCVVLQTAVIDVLLLPCYLNDVKYGLWNALWRKLKTYDSKLQGILLGYESIKVDIDAGRFYGRNAEIRYPAFCNCYVFQPSVGSLLEGTINQISPDHIGCIVHKYFNATIKRPEAEDHEHWSNRCVNFKDNITFRVSDIDYSGIIPYIEGELLDFPKRKDVKNPSSSTLPSRHNGHGASSESGVEDLKPPKSSSKKKREKRNYSSLISSTQLPAKASESHSDSGLDFDFLSPIPVLGVKGRKPTKDTPTVVNAMRKKKNPAEAGEPEDPFLRPEESKQTVGPKTSTSKQKGTPAKKIEVKNNVEDDEDAGDLFYSQQTKEKLLNVRVPKRQKESPSSSSKKQSKNVNFLEHFSPVLEKVKETPGTSTKNVDSLSSGSIDTVWMTEQLERLKDEPLKTPVPSAKKKKKVEQKDKRKEVLPTPKTSKKQADDDESMDALRARLMEEQLNWIRNDSPPPSPIPSSVKRKRKDSTSEQKRKKSKLETKSVQNAASDELDKLPGETKEKVATVNGDTSEKTACNKTLLSDTVDSADLTMSADKPKTKSSKKRLFYKIPNLSKDTQDTKDKKAEKESLEMLDSNCNSAQGKGTLKEGKTEKSKSKAGKEKQNKAKEVKSPQKFSSTAENNSDSKPAKGKETLKERETEVPKKSKEKKVKSSGKKETNLSVQHLESSAVSTGVAETSANDQNTKTSPTTPVSSRKPKVKQDPVAKLAAYFKKMKKLASKTEDPSLLKNMIRSLSSGPEGGD